uniref:Uncharacterized protein n=1 Tax=Salix viminalis TaxID=40686 RepID=A0A6N2MAN2_SALVM
MLYSSSPTSGISTTLQTTITRVTPVSFLKRKGGTWEVLISCCWFWKFILQMQGKMEFHFNVTLLSSPGLTLCRFIGLLEDGNCIYPPGKNNVESPSHSFRSYSVSSSDNEGGCSAIANCITRRLSIPPPRANSSLSSSSKVAPQPSSPGIDDMAGPPRLVRSRALRRDLFPGLRKEESYLLASRIERFPLQQERVPDPSSFGGNKTNKILITKPITRGTVLITFLGIAG